MKIKKSTLKRIIQEELEQVLQESPAHFGRALYRAVQAIGRTADEYGPSMTIPAIEGYHMVPLRDIEGVDQLSWEQGRQMARDRGRGEIYIPSYRNIRDAAAAPTGAPVLPRLRDAAADYISQFGDTRRQEQTPPTRASEESPATRPQTSASRPPPIAMGTADTQDYMRTQRRIGPGPGFWRQAAW